MAFYAHILPPTNLATGSWTYLNTGSLGFTALPETTVTGILDTIVADLADAVASGTNNGWTLYEDFRASGALPTWGASGALSGYNYTGGQPWAWAGTASYLANFITYLYPPYGQLNLYPFGTNSEWTFTTNSLYVVSDASYGWNPSYFISSTSGSSPWNGSGTVVTLDAVNWYTMYTYAAAAVKTTSALDRPYQGATTANRYLLELHEQAIIMKYSSSSGTFYVQIDVPKNRAGGSTLFFRVWENYITSGTGFYASQWERALIYHADGAHKGNNQNCQAMVWFADGWFGLFTNGTSEQHPGKIPISNLFYAGYLDPAGVRSSDPYALAMINSNTTYTGMGSTYVASSNVAYPLLINCGYPHLIRTSNGMLCWNQPGENTPPDPRAYSNVFPRSRWYSYDPAYPAFNLDGKVEATPYDIYQTSGGGYNEYMFSSSDGRRGKIKGVLCPVTNPSWRHLDCVDMDDGKRYLFLSTRNSGLQYAVGRGNGQYWFGNATKSTLGQEASRQVMSAWSWGSKGLSTTNQNLGDLYYNGNTSAAAGSGGAFLQHLLQISGSGV